jgi:predicted HD superfamily hydrolase involved in NAD metabolism
MLKNKLVKIKTWIKANISPKRYEHIRGVAQTSRKLAVRYGLPEDQVELASWLHDCAKELSKDEMKNWIKKGLSQLDATEQKMPALWHPHAGASIALHRWKIKNPKILEAIRCHTLGSSTMSSLAQIVFVADFIEPGRDFEGVSKVRIAAFKDLNQAVLMKCSMTISHLLSDNLKIHPRLLDTWNSFLEKKNEK